MGLPTAEACGKTPLTALGSDLLHLFCYYVNGKTVDACNIFSFQGKPQFVKFTDQIYLLP